MAESTCQVEVDRTTPAEWSEMLDLFHDANLYQSWSYGGVRWGGKNLSHLVVRRNGEILGMAQLRIVRPTRFKFGMAYLRWGPLCHRRGKQLDVEVALSMARALQEEYVGKRRLLLRVLPNAFVGSERAVLFQTAFSGFVTEPRSFSNTYRTFILDLAPPLEELRKKLDGKWRNKLNQSEKKGLKVVTGSGVDEYRTFCEMYYEMRRRKTFESTVDVEEFGRIQEDLPEPHRMRILICEQGGIAVAGMVSSAMGDTGIYLLGATSDNGLNSKAAYLLQWTAIQWLKEGGFRWYDLGGIDPEHNPGVYSFKSGLSGIDVSHMKSLVSYSSVMTSVVVKASEAARTTLRGCMGRLRRARALTSSAIVN
jgi:hypothetical protein